MKKHLRWSDGVSQPDQIKKQMKKIIAILLLFIHLYNIGGQLAIYQYLVFQSDRLYDAEIGQNHYNVEDLTEIRVPVNTPGITDWHGYINLSGSVRFKNNSYNYVKIRMTSTAIYLVCIPNYATTHLLGHNIIYARQIPDIPVPKKDHVPFGKINQVAYSYQTVTFKFSTPLIIYQKNICTNHSLVPDCYISRPGQPPDPGFQLS